MTREQSLRLGAALSIGTLLPFNVTAFETGNELGRSFFGSCSCF